MSDWNIWTTDSNGNHNEQFLSARAPGYSPTGEDYSPAFSRTPGSSTILWHTYQQGEWDLWLMDADGSNKRRIPNATALVEKNPDWAMNDTRIVYDAGPSDDDTDIWMMHVDGTNRHVIAATSGRDKAPSL
jgi:Tol biopolymer transport system component